MSRHPFFLILAALLVANPCGANAQSPNGTTASPPSSDVPASMGTAPAETAAGKSATAPADKDTTSTATALSYVGTVIIAAALLGYVAKFRSDDGAVKSVELTKEGKTEEGFGILNKKWDEKENVYIKFIVDNNGRISIIDKKTTVEHKAPIGPWRTVTTSPDLPSNLEESIANAVDKKPEK